MAEDAQTIAPEIASLTQQLTETGFATHATRIRKLIDDQTQALGTVWEKHHIAVDELFRHWVILLKRNNSDPTTFEELGLTHEDTGRVSLHNSKTIVLPQADTYIPSLIRAVNHISVCGDNLGMIEETTVVDAMTEDTAATFNAEMLTRV
ncbi:MAG: hypothetical protein ACOCXQ_01120 [Patescibacteria group bacterium]